MIRIEAVVQSVGLAPEELADWIARGWVAAHGTPPDWEFAPVELARVRLVRDLRHEAGIEADTLPVVLSLLDQVYDLRHELYRVLHAVADQPPEIRDKIRAALLARLQE